MNGEQRQMGTTEMNNVSISTTTTKYIIQFNLDDICINSIGISFTQHNLDNEMKIDRL